MIGHLHCNLYHYLKEDVGYTNQQHFQCTAQHKHSAISKRLNEAHSGSDLLNESHSKFLRYATASLIA